MIFAESTAGGAPANCAASTSVGDTHLTTLSGLLYDFQATGDFELLETKSGFVVQNRQVSGAPTWPNAAVNSAIAALLGKTKVAVCLAPQKVVVDGKVLPLRQGQVERLGDGTQISLRGNSYLLRGASGDWVKADVVTNHIDVTVGLGQWPIQAQGLLVSANGDPNQVATRDGPVLKIPFSFEEFYHRYGESWRVRPANSMLNVCGEAKQSGLPSKPFYAKDLDPQIAKRVRAICSEAGIKPGPLLDACMIDVAFTGQKSAADVRAEPVSQLQSVSSDRRAAGTARGATTPRHLALASGRGLASRRDLPKTRLGAETKLGVENWRARRDSNCPWGATP